MNRICKFISLAAAALILMFSVSAYAAGDSIKTKNLTVKTDRLFEVNIGLNSERTITAARFKLTYNKDDIEFRNALCNLSRAKVRCNDKKGYTDVIFLCSNGLKCDKFPTLFSVKYKKLNDNNADISIRATDCVDGNLKSFSISESAVCRVKGVPNSSSGGAASGKSGSGKTAKSGNTNDEDILETSGKSAVADDEYGSAVFTGSNDPEYLSFIPIIFLVIFVAFFLVVLYQNVRIKRIEKQKDEEKE